MDGRLRVFLLRAMALLVVAGLLPGCGMLGKKSGPAETDASAPVIEPKVERREVKPPEIDTENFELTGFFGLISVEDFGTNGVYGARLGYHVTENFFLEGTYGTTGDVQDSSFETLTNVDLLGGDRKYSYYNLAVGWNVLPGEVFIGRSRAFNSALYVLGGAGSTSFAGDDLFTFMFGAGYRVLATDSVALHFDVRDYLFNNDITGEDKTTNNIEFTLGVSWFF